ncbi:MAG TPA: hypothetical protein VME46_25040 [Acidimicrobiales bacterium]|nr:hypothetical protein [Acidimicrobiales bacterium]
MRALLVLVVAAVVAVVVLARLAGGPAGSAATPTTSLQTTTSTSAKTGPSTVSSPTTTTTVVTPAATTTTIAPSHVLVLVLNGWTTYHAALYFKNQLSFYDYDLKVPEDAETDTNTRSLVFYTHAQYEPSATQIAKDLHLSPSAVVAPSPTNDGALTVSYIDSADVILLVGEDISGRVPSGYKG